MQIYLFNITHLNITQKPGTYSSIVAKLYTTYTLAYFSITLFDLFNQYLQLYHLYCLNPLKDI